jgi:hypothetical protein
LPEAETNDQATGQATDHARAGKDWLLFTLHQLPQNIPGTGVFQPKDAANLIEPPKGRVGTATNFNVCSLPALLSDAFTFSRSDAGGDYP